MKEIPIYQEDFSKELLELETEYKELTRQLNEYGKHSCYQQGWWDRRIEVVKRIKQIKEILRVN